MVVTGADFVVVVVVVLLVVSGGRVVVAALVVVVAAFVVDVLCISNCRPIKVYDVWTSHHYKSTETKR